MITEEIVGRRFPRSCGYRIPHSEFIEQADPSLHDVNEYSSLEIGMNPSENVAINNTNPDEAQGPEIEGNTQKYEIGTPKLFPNSYTRRIAADQAMIAEDIRKYLSSNHVNPVRNSSYFGNRRRLTKFSFSF
ncbi:MAG TPA: hypothetical protein VLR10_01775 [Nitrososphaeraceae archaeon]|nr:hypothetical protein [Nitrososphaeraceae archaeon]